MLGPAAIPLAPIMLMAGAFRAIEDTVHPPSTFQSDCYCAPGNVPQTPQRDVTSTAGVGAAYFEYQGRQYPRLGERWQGDSAVARVSADGTRLAFVSQSGPLTPGGLERLRPSMRWWDTYLEVYSVTTGNRLATLKWLRTREAAPLRVRIDWDQRVLGYSISSGSSIAMRCSLHPDTHVVTLRSRETFDLFDEQGARVKLTFQPIDDDANGRVEAMEIGADFVVPAPGRYRFTVRFNGRDPVVQYATWAAGAAHMAIRVSPADMPLHLLDGVEIRSPDMQVTLTDEFQFDRLPPLDTTPFRLINPDYLTVLDGSVRGSFWFETPGGECTWSGVVVKGASRKPFTGKARLKPGRELISFDVPGAYTASDAVAVELNQFTCNGRRALPRPGEPVLARQALE